MWALNNTLQDQTVMVELRLVDTETGQVRERKSFDKQVLPPNRSLELTVDHKVDDRTAVQAIMLKADGQVIGRGSDWPQPLKYVHLPALYDIKVNVQDGKVEVTSNAPVKGLELYIPDESRKVYWDDNCIDVFPGDTYVVNCTGLTKEDDVRIRFYGMDWIPTTTALSDTDDRLKTNSC
jgi:beta-mannosidase